MTRLRQFALSAVAALVTLAPMRAQAQSSPLVGDWSVEITAGMRIENDEATPIRAKAKLSIALVGDSLVATLTVEPSADVAPRPPGRFAAARTAANTVNFTQRSEATLNNNGQETKATVISSWSLTADGDAIKGTVSRAIEGMMGPGMPAQPVTGTRIK